jgi:hypothetical protein
VAESKNKQAHGGGKPALSHEAEAQIMREKMARLKALRLARDAANPPPEVVAKPAKRGAAKKKSGKAAEKGKLADWLTSQESQGRRN